MRELDPFERLCIEFSLEGNIEELVQLRDTVDYVRVNRSRFTGVGFVSELSLLSGATPTSVGNGVLCDIDGETDNLQHGFGIVVFVTDGRLSALEGFTFDESWPSTLLLPRLTYTTVPRVLSRTVSGFTTQTLSRR